MKNLDFKRSIYAGIAAGIIFIILEMILVPLFLDASPWETVRMIAAIILGPDILRQETTSFDIGVIMVGILLHLFLSVIYTIIIVLIISDIKLSMALLIGAAIGIAIYLVNFFIFTGWFPWFAAARYWISALSHIVFGLSAVWIYRELVRKHHTAHSA